MATNKPIKKKLRAALVGLEDGAAGYLSMIQADDRFELVAVADVDSRTLRSYAEGASWRAYEDCRSLVVECAHEHIDCLFVASEPFRSVDFLPLAAQRGYCVLHKAPFARTTLEATRILNIFFEYETPLLVPSIWPDSQPSALPDSPVQLVGRISAANATVRTTDRTDGWRGDAARAGGGVLLNGAFSQIDVLVHFLGLPESVYAQASCVVSGASTRNYDTEDAIAVTLRFSDNRIASLGAFRGAPASSWCVTLCGTEGIAELSARNVRVHLPGKAAKDYPISAEAPDASAIDRAARNLLEGIEMVGNADSHLLPLAVIDAAYLSLKTGEPELPAQFLE